MQPFFICNQDEIDRKVKTLTLIETNHDRWTEHYVDKTTGENWVLTRFNSEYQGGGIPVLKRLPERSVDQLIEIAVISSDINDIIGASRELSEREKCSREDFRHKLISQLLKVDISDLSLFERERLKYIIHCSGLHDPTNRRDIVGKYITEIQNDAAYYQAIAQKAEMILSSIEE